LAPLANEDKEGQRRPIQLSLGFEIYAKSNTVTTVWVSLAIFAHTRWAARVKPNVSRKERPTQARPNARISLRELGEVGGA
jgi:hypothetical protein